MCVVSFQEYAPQKEINLTTMHQAPKAVVFDVLETLLDIGPLSVRFLDVGQPESLLDNWFMRFQRDAMALSLAGDAAYFEPVARQALRTETQHSLNEEEIDYILEGFASLPAFEDAPTALRRLVDEGVTTACLTVGSPANTHRFLRRAGLEELLQEVVTIRHAGGVWKPAPDVYHFTANTLRVPIGEMALVAVHAWDCHGAKKAGALAGWCDRLESRPGDVFQPADVHGSSLVEVVDGLLKIH